MRGLSFQCHLHFTNAGSHRRKTSSGPATRCHGQSQLPHNQRQVSRDVPDIQGCWLCTGTLPVSGDVLRAILSELLDPPCSP